MEAINTDYSVQLQKREKEIIEKDISKNNLIDQLNKSKFEISDIKHTYEAKLKDQVSLSTSTNQQILN